MKKTVLFITMLCLAVSASAQLKSRVIEDGGTGPYKAIMTEGEGLPEHTVFVPQDLSVFNAKNPLPVLVWGNGACSNSPWEHMNFLNEIASHGYMVLATGIIPMVDEWYKGPMSRTEQQIESIDWAYAQNANPQSPYYQKIAVKDLCVAGMSCGGLQTLFNCAALQPAERQSGRGWYAHAAEGQVERDPHAYSLPPRWSGRYRLW